MKTFWKWVLAIVVGILITLVILAIAVPFFMHGFWGHDYGMMSNYNRGGDYGDWQHPMMGGRGFMPFYGGFFMLGGLFRLIIPLALLGLVGYGIYQWGKHSSQPAQAVVAAAAIPPAAEPVAETVSTHTCASCGKPAQDDWATCPYCGTQL